MAESGAWLSRRHDGDAGPFPVAVAQTPAPRANRDQFRRAFREGKFRETPSRYYGAVALREMVFDNRVNDFIIDKSRKTDNGRKFRDAVGFSLRCSFAGSAT